MLTPNRKYKPKRNDSVTTDYLTQNGWIFGYFGINGAKRWCNPDVTEKAVPFKTAIRMQKLIDGKVIPI